MSSATTTEWDNIRRNVNQKIERENPCLAHLAKSIGTDYRTLRRWLIGAIEPRATMALRLQAWTVKASKKPKTKPKT